MDITPDGIDSGTLQPVLDLFDREIVWEATGLGVTGLGKYLGHRGVVQFWHDWFDVFKDVGTTVTSLEASGDKVVAVSRQHGTGVSSGTEATWEFAQVFTLRDSKIVRADFFVDIGEARRLAGLDPASEGVRPV